MYIQPHANRGQRTTWEHTLWHRQIQNVKKKKKKESKLLKRTVSFTYNDPHSYHFHYHNRRTSRKSVFLTTWAPKSLSTTLDPCYFMLFHSSSSCREQAPWAQGQPTSIPIPRYHKAVHMRLNNLLNGSEACLLQNALPLKYLSKHLWEMWLIFAFQLETILVFSSYFSNSIIRVKKRQTEIDEAPMDLTTQIMCLRLHTCLFMCILCTLTLFTY